MALYVNTLNYAEHVALWKGDIGRDEPALVRMHAINVLDDVLGDSASGKAGDLQQAMRMIGEAGRGVVVLIREPSADVLSSSLRARLEGQPKAGSQLRDYGVGAQILLDLGVRDMVLLSNTKRTIVGLEGYGLRVRSGERRVGKGG